MVYRDSGFGRTGLADGDWSWCVVSVTHTDSCPELLKDESDDWWIPNDVSEYVQHIIAHWAGLKNCSLKANETEIEMVPEMTPDTIIMIIEPDRLEQHIASCASLAARLRLKMPKMIFTNRSKHPLSWDRDINSSFALKKEIYRSSILKEISPSS